VYTGLKTSEGDSNTSCDPFEYSIFGEFIVMVEQNTEATEVTEATEATKSEQVTHLQFIAAFVASKKDGTGLAGVAAKTGLEKGTCQTRASNIRNGQFKMVNKTVGGETVYRSAVPGENGETETTDKALAKSNKQGKLIPIKVKALGADGKPIVTVRPIPLPQLPREGGVRNEAHFDEAMALLATLEGEG